MNNLVYKKFSKLDKALVALNNLLVLDNKAPYISKSNPADPIIEKPMDTHSLRTSQGLMRINHTGEVCAQALYVGQAITARCPQKRALLNQSAEEERDHLNWCEQRLNELMTRTSYLNPLWYTASIGLGMIAGLMGDGWSFGFLAETENQVVNHLNHHLDKISPEDEKSRAILKQMRQDEAHHAHMAMNHGGQTLPLPVKLTMRFCSKLMTSSVYYI